MILHLSVYQFRHLTIFYNVPFIIKLNVNIPIIPPIKKPNTNPFQYLCATYATDFHLYKTIRYENDVCLVVQTLVLFPSFISLTLILKKQHNL